MLRFAFGVGLLGVCCALGLAVAAWLRLPMAAQPTAYELLFCAVFLSFVPAIIAHPARTSAGHSSSVSIADVLRCAAPWTVAVLVCAWLALAVSFVFGPLPDAYVINASSLTGRIDRQLELCAFFSVCHASAIAIASSGLRWRGALASPPAPAVSTPSEESTINGVPVASPGLPLIYRQYQFSWGYIVLLVVAVLALTVWGGERTAELTPHGRLLPLLLLVVPLCKGLLKRYGRITIFVNDGYLVLSHFPVTSRSRRILLEDIRGIQVREVLRQVTTGSTDDRSTETVANYSLMLITDYSAPEALIEDLPNPEHGRQLAQQIDVLVRAAL